MADQKPITTIDDYIGAFPADVRAILEQIRQTIRKAAPAAIETISYGMPTFDLNGEHLVFFAGWKRHISVYPLPAGDQALQERMAQYKRGRGTIQFPLARSIPYDLIGDMVTFLQKEKPANAPPPNAAGNASNP